MAYKLSVFNRKGGVGKTTIAMNLAAAAASESKDASGKYTPRVLLIDLDPQGACSSYAALSAAARAQVGPEAANRDMRVVLRDKGSLKDAWHEYSYRKWLTREEPGCHFGLYYDVREKEEIKKPFKVVNVPNFKIVPGYEDIDLDYDVDEFLYNLDPFTLRDRIREVEDDFDWIIIDCPPSWNRLSKSAVVATENFLVPIKPGWFELNGLAALLKQVDIFNGDVGTQFDFKAEPLKIVFGHVQGSIREHVNQAISLREVFNEILCQTQIPLSVEAVHSLKNELPFAFSNNGGSKLKAAYAGLFEEVKRSFAVKENKVKEVANG